MPHGCPGTRRNYGREHEPTTNIHTTGVPRHASIHLFEGRRRGIKTRCTRRALKASWWRVWVVGQRKIGVQWRGNRAAWKKKERINAAKLSNNRLAVFASGSGLKCDMKYGGWFRGGNFRARGDELMKKNALINARNN